jgi:hypothetical protein
MKTWWQANGANLPIRFKDEDNEEIEDLTGKIPLFVECVTFKLGNYYEVEDDEAESESEQDATIERTADEIYADKLDNILEGFWWSRRVKRIVATVIEFAEDV